MSGLITQKRFVTEALEAHNKYRKLHNVQPLELDAQLNREACEWAEHLAEVGELKYRSTFYNKESLGENILRTRQSYLNGNVSKQGQNKNKVNKKVIFVLLFC